MSKKIAEPTEEPTYECRDCGTELKIPENPLPREVVNCLGCGLEYEVKKKNGNYELEELKLEEGEDWGE